MKTILGTGQEGLAILEILLGKNPNEPILLVNRSGKLDRPLPPTVQLVAADVTSKADMRTIAQKSELIFSCTDVAYPLWADFYPAVATALAYALRETTTRLVFADNLYSYGNVRGQEMIETMPHQALTKKGMVRVLAINTLLQDDQGFSHRVAFVKAADFIGPRIHKGLFGTDFLAKLYASKPILLAGNIAQPHTFTYINDFATALVNVGTASDAFGQLWHAPNTPALSLDKWLHLFEVITNKPIKKRIVPKIGIKIAGYFNSFTRELYEMVYQFEYPFTVNHDKYVSRFGNHATYPSDIVKETLRWYNSLSAADREPYA